MSIKEMAPWLAIAITLILSILVPLFTQIANNKFQLKLKKQEQENLEREKAIQAYEEFFKYAGGCVMHANEDNFSEAGASIQRLYLYYPEKQWDELDRLYNLIKELRWPEAQYCLVSISKTIANTLK